MISFCGDTVLKLGNIVPKMLGDHNHNEREKVYCVKETFESAGGGLCKT